MNIIDNFKDDKYKFLLNSEIVPNGIFYDAQDYPSVEHAFQAAKTNDLNIKEVIRKASVKEARQIGKSLKLIDNWDSIKVDIMEDLIKCKFANYHLEKLLLATGDAELVAGGDKFWGRIDGEGENILGKILMEERKNIFIYSNNIFKTALKNVHWKENDQHLFSPPWNPECFMDLKSAVFHQLKMNDSK